MIAAGGTDSTSVILDLVRSGGVLGLLTFAIVGSVRRWWFPGWYVEELARDRDEWKQMALAGTQLAERQSTVLEHAVTRGAQLGRG